MEHFYTLPDLLDLALKVPEVGAVNFNMLYTLLKGMIVASKMNDVRVWHFAENPILVQSALNKAKLKEKDVAQEMGSAEVIIPETHQPQVAPPTAGKPEEATSTKSEENKGNDKQEPHSPQIDKETERKPQAEKEKEELPPKESIDQSPKTSDETEIQSHTEETKEDMTPKESTNSEETKEDMTPKESINSEETKEDMTPKESINSEETTKNRDEGAVYDNRPQHFEKDSKTKKTNVLTDTLYQQLIKRITATEEGMQQLFEVMQKLADKMNKRDAKRKPGGISVEDMELLEERVEELEEAREVFEEDHVKLSDIQNTQKKMVDEFEEIKALGSKIQEMKNEIASKADSKEMEEALALKGDLELVNTKVDQTEFETAIEELGEAIGLLGCKFQKKNDEWEERAAEMWRAIDGKMSRDIFDEAVLKINSRLTALMLGLKTIKKVVDDLLYPDSSGVTRCIACRRPAGISRNKCFDPKEIYKKSEDYSDSSCVHEKFLKNVSDALGKLPKVDEPPFSDAGDTIISTPKETSPETKADFKMGAINGETDQSRKTGHSKASSQVPSLPQIQRDKTAISSNNQKHELKYSVPKVRAKQRNTELIFIPKVLDRLQREKKLIPNASKEKKLSSSSSIPHLTSEDSKISASSIISDAASNLESFAPLRLMQDPLRKEIILSPPDRSKTNKSTVKLAPLHKDISSNKIPDNQR